MSGTPESGGELRYYFIRRPVMAGVIAIVIILLGLVLAALHAGQPLSGDHAAVDPDHRRLPRRHRRRRGERRGSADRAAAFGFARPAVLQVGELQRRHDEPAGVLRHFPQPGPGGGGRAERGQAGRAAAAPGSGPQRRRGDQGADRHPAGGGVVVDRRALRRHVPHQLRHAVPGRRDQAPARRGRCAGVRRRPARDAARPRSRQDGPARPHGRRRGRGGAGAERAGPGRPAGPRAVAAGNANSPFRLPPKGDCRRPTSSATSFCAPGRTDR